MSSSSTQAAHPRVVVVGGGIIGLTSALALLESGYAHVHVVAESFDAIVSHVAGAIWMPFALPASVTPHKPRQWCEVSMAWLTKLWEQHGEQETGIHFVKGVDVSGEGAPAVVHPYWAHCVRDFRLLSAQEAEAICPGTAHGFAFETIVYNPTYDYYYRAALLLVALLFLQFFDARALLLYLDATNRTFMKFIRKQIVRLGGTFETRKLASLDEISDCDVVVNCTGLGARELVADESAFPIRGQTIKVHNPNIKQFTMVVHGDSQHTYILPRPGGEVVLGGTVQPHNWKNVNDESDIRAIWERCCALNPEVRKSKVLGQAAGLRPQRTSGVRLEVDPRTTTSSGAVVIHNYAHAGSGHTLQWGCAQDVVRLAKQYRPPTFRSASRL